MIRPLVLHPDESLNKKSDIIPPTEEWASIAQELIEAMHHYNGVGLAAVQIGLPYRCFVVKLTRRDMCLFDPVLIRTRGPMVEDTEGCLSIPGVAVSIRRPSVATFTYAGPDRTIMTLGVNGAQARRCLHEYDHLNGITILDHQKRMMG
jgi:peptide deformylase